MPSPIKLRTDYSPAQLRTLAKSAKTNTFLVLNDGTAGFQDQKDVVIKLVNPSSIGASNFIT